MKVYLAARYQEQAAMQACRAEWARGGIEVTSRWIDGKHDGVAAEICALDDFADIDAADALVLWNPREQHGAGRGGRHVELGYAIAKGKRVLLLGDRENVFHSHPTVEVYEDFATAYMALTREPTP